MLCPPLVKLQERNPIRTKSCNQYATWHLFDNIKVVIVDSYKTVYCTASNQYESLCVSVRNSQNHKKQLLKSSHSIHLFAYLEEM